MTRPPTFRKRLVWTTSAFLALALFLLVVGIWLGAYGWLNSVARLALQQEIQEVQESIVSAEGTLAADRYNWNEPHHLYSGRHVDPFYLQVFDAGGRLVRQSENISPFPPGEFPAHLMAGATGQDGWFEPLRTFRIGEMTLYYAVVPVLNAAGERIGSIQLSREDPGLRVLYGRLAATLLAGLVMTLMLLSFLVWWVAGRVLRPLESITRAADTLSPAHLEKRIPVPPEADLETTRLAGTLNALLDRLETAFEDTRRFTSSAAHELRTPLTVIQGHVDVALRQERSPEAYRDTLGLVRRKVGHLVSMVAGLLSLARLDSGAVDVDRDPVDITRVVKDMAAALKPRAVAKGLDFRLSVPEDAVHVDGQDDLLQHVVTNLVDNAVKFTRDGRVTANLTREGEWAVLTVSDTGMGMSPDVVAHATDRFFRARTVHAAGIEGSGLGLAVASELVRWHRGTMDIDSDGHSGTTVRVRLPLSPSVEPVHTS
ncbi:MAG: HAMP domain-containing sensor histidine kinase [Rhodothermales bacterium]